MCIYIFDSKRKPIKIYSTTIGRSSDIGRPYCTNFISKSVTVYTVDKSTATPSQ